MEPARVRFLEEGEEPVLPKWTKLLPQRWRQRKTVDTYPYTLTRVDGVLTGILQAERTAVLTADWRGGAVRLLAALEEAGCCHHCAACRGRISQRTASLCRGAQAGTAFCLRRCGRGIAPAGQKSGGIGISSGRGRAAYLGEGAFLSGK